MLSHNHKEDAHKLNVYLFSELEVQCSNVALYGSLKVRNRYILGYRWSIALEDKLSIT